MRANLSRRWLRLVVPSLAAFLFVARCQGGFREDELECEQAADELMKCCPGFQATNLSCTYSDGCGTVYPALTVSESQCIDSESCATLVSTGVCERATAALPIDADDGGAPSTHPQVCP